MKLTADKILSLPDGIKLLRTAKLRCQKAIETRKKPGHITDYYLVSLTWYTGLRISEVCRLKWNDIGHDFLTVTGKGDKKRTVFFGQRVSKNLEEYRSLIQEESNPNQEIFFGQKGPLSESGIHRRFKLLAAAAGLPETVSFHSLRHGYATRLASRGIPLAAVRDQLGHSNISTTSVYLHFTDQFKEQIQNLT